MPSHTPPPHSSPLALTSRSQLLLRLQYYSSQPHSNIYFCFHASVLIQTWDFLVAGRDTTACAATWLMYFFCTRPDVVEKVREGESFPVTFVNIIDTSKRILLLGFLATYGSILCQYLVLGFYCELWELFVWVYQYWQVEKNNLRTCRCLLRTRRRNESFHVHLRTVHCTVIGTEQCF